MENGMGAAQLCFLLTKNRNSKNKWEIDKLCKTRESISLTETMRVVKGETATRTSFQRSAKGNVSIQEANADGKFIVLENTHRSKEEPLSEWKLKRKIDGKREIVYTLPKDYVLKPGKSVKVWWLHEMMMTFPRF